MVESGWLLRRSPNNSGSSLESVDVLLVVFIRFKLHVSDVGLLGILDFEPFFKRLVIQRSDNWHLTTVYDLSILVYHNRSLIKIFD
jgi:hypothetical protein